MDINTIKYVELGTKKQDLPSFDRAPVLNWDGPVTVDSQHAHRSLAIHFLYSARTQDYEVPLGAIIHDYQDAYGLVVAPDALAVQLAEGVIASRECLDALIKPCLKNWDLNRLETTTLLVLRMAVWESLNTKTERSVIINEAIELAKGFADDKAGAFVNGLLDTILTK